MHRPARARSEEHADHHHDRSMSSEHGAPQSRTQRIARA
ncbi:hypothetical protein DB32_004031 [Sandaracinus amylolyticus]|uniref:Uncharacterized protein n=1 Tax=Sandaracinus amylolyticus TaxID=927083 RepID=A0A0F6YIM7_9BACT|nr:hypothetical protein DB32_004031 [Sandaracinus amylolyticus]